MKKLIQLILLLTIFIGQNAFAAAMPDNKIDSSKTKGGDPQTVGDGGGGGSYPPDDDPGEKPGGGIPLPGGGVSIPIGDGGGGGHSIDPTRFRVIFPAPSSKPKKEAEDEKNIKKGETKEGKVWDGTKWVDAPIWDGSKWVDAPKEGGASGGKEAEDGKNIKKGKTKEGKVWNGTKWVDAPIWDGSKWVDAPKEGGASGGKEGGASGGKEGDSDKKEKKAKKKKLEDTVDFRDKRLAKTDAVIKEQILKIYEKRGITLKDGSFKMKKNTIGLDSEEVTYEISFKEQAGNKFRCAVVFFVRSRELVIGQCFLKSGKTRQGDDNTKRTYKSEIENIIVKKHEKERKTKGKTK